MPNSVQNHLPQLGPKRPPNGKIAIIGGGDLNCVSFLTSIINHPEVLQGQHIVLMDTDKEQLTQIFTLCQQAFQQYGIDTTLERTTKIEEAMEDASFILTTFRTGGLPARILDEKIPLSHGLIGQDTIGVGGFFYALRTTPALAGIAAIAEKIAPKAFFLNYSNPSNIVMEAISYSSGIRTIGVNSSITKSIQLIMQLIEIPYTEHRHFHPRTIGLSHGHWTTEIWQDADNILPQIVARCEEYLQDNREMTSKNYEQIMLARLTADYKAIPSYFMHYYYFPEIVLEFQQRRKTTPAKDLLTHMPDLIAQYQELTQQPSQNIRLPLQTETIGHTFASDAQPHDTGPDYKTTIISEKANNKILGEMALGVINSILHDTGDEWVLNVPNNGAINFIADDRAVELPCSVDARGATPLTLGDGGLHMEQRGLISLLAEYEGASARAALWGNRRDAIKALASNPLVMSYSKAEKVYDDLAAAHAQYLPQRLLH